MSKTQQRLPDWFKQSRGKRQATQKLSKWLQAEVPNSICEEAKCPNRSECFTKGVLTFMILGTVCTRTCSFCSVKHGKPLPPDPSELFTILKTIETLNLKFVVLTSPNRDDLPDGGAGHYAYIVQGIKSKFPHVKVEILIPDFKGKIADVQTVIEGGPDVLNHNIETVPSLYKTVRKGSLFKRSIDLLAEVKRYNPRMLTKSGVMVGLGETTEELLETFKDIRSANVDILTIGQYLKPDKNSIDMVRYYHPDEFDKLKIEALKCGFRYVFSGPSVRSSYLADYVFDETLLGVT